MKSLKSSALREKSTDELKALVAEKNEALFNLKLRHAAGGLESPADLAATRRDIARIQGVLTEKRSA
jgi:ribosomal protein L29